MAQANSAQREPTMEEILASIRRIIEDSDAGAKQANDSVPPVKEVAGAVRQEPKFEVVNNPALTERVEVSRETQIAEDRRNDDFDLAAVRAVSDVLEREMPAHDANAHAPRRQAEESSMNNQGRFGQAPKSEQPAWDSQSQVAPTRERIEPAMQAAKPSFAPTAPRSLEGEGQGVYRQTAPSVSARAEENVSIQSAIVNVQPELQAPAPRQDVARPDTEKMLSEQAGQQIAAAFGELNVALEANRRRELDEMAKTMLRPMLQDWLDNNLPSLVEKLVREEIERIARGGR
ncbi:PopZ family protein [Limoniibacter endophyticus]|nr:DUF2497 domain-containing protein [Limoniibacter endophyticus]